jgi:a disintegrin and metalloproteinase with thrombospondin motifs 18
LFKPEKKRIKTIFFSWAKCLFDRPRPFDTLNGLDAWKYSGYPGISYTAKDQCEILLRDRLAYEFVNGDLSKLCENLHCRTPNRPGFFFAGPPLSGTSCGSGRWCEEGKCQFKKDISATYSTTTKQPKTTKGSCKSECLKYGKGIQKAIHITDIDLVSVNLCDDTKICKSRQTIVAYGTQKCKEFSIKVPEIDGASILSS